MGQMTHAIMLGCDRPDLPKGKLWHGDVVGKRYRKGVLDLYAEAHPGQPRPDMPSGDTEDDVIGFWVAVGASGEEGCPDLDVGFPLDDFAHATDKYRLAHERALAAWRDFAEWATTQGVNLGAPRLWLVLTEVA